MQIKEKQNISFKKPRKNKVYKTILFSIPYLTKENLKTEDNIIDFVCMQEPAFPIYMDISNMY